MFDPAQNPIPTFFLLMPRPDPNGGEPLYAPVAQGVVLCGTTTVLRWHGPAVHSVGVYSTFSEMAEQVTHNGLRIMPATPDSPLYETDFSERVRGTLLERALDGAGPVPESQDEPETGEGPAETMEEPERPRGTLHDAEAVRRMAAQVQQTTQQLQERRLQEAQAEGVAEDGDGYMAN